MLLLERPALHDVMSRGIVTFFFLDFFNKFHPKVEAP